MCSDPPGDADITETRGRLRPLAAAERRAHATAYKYAVEAPYALACRGRRVEVPAGFLSDGSSGGPDSGTAWLYHDYLYATHAFSSGEACTRAEADALMVDVLHADRAHAYARGVRFLAWANPFWAFSRAWAASGARGPEFLRGGAASADTTSDSGSSGSG